MLWNAAKLFVVGTFALTLVVSSASAQERTKTVLVQPDVQISGPTLGIQAVTAANGLEVVNVFGHTAASRLGLEAGDRVVQVNGRSIRSVYDLQSALRDAAAYNGGLIRVLIDNVRARAGFHGEPSLRQPRDLLGRIQRPLGWLHSRANPSLHDRPLRLSILLGRTNAQSPALKAEKNAAGREESTASSVFLV